MATPNVIVKNGVDDIEFFGKVDINKHGNRGSEMPAWYFRSQKEEIENNISQIESSISRGEIAEDKKPQILADKRKMQEKLDAINESQPRFDPQREDAIAGVAKSIGEKISEAMFTRSDMLKGIADAHEEARRMADPCIKIEGSEFILAKKAGCKISKDMKVSRTDAERLWKMCRRALGENSNTEILRRN